MKARPEYMHCIADAHADNAGKAVCGRPLAGFHFIDLDHWFMNARCGGRLVGCDECVDEVVRAVLGERP